MPDALCPLVIFGSGGHGRETLDVVEAVNEHVPTYLFGGFVADYRKDEALVARRDATILAADEGLPGPGTGYVVAVGSGELRRDVAERIGAGGGRAVKLVHPIASVATRAELGLGCVLFAGSRVGPGARLGVHVHLNSNALVGAGSVVDDYGTLSPGSVVGSDCHLAEGVLLGAGASVLDGVRVGAGATVGAGAIVGDDLPAGATAVGLSRG